MPLKITNKIIKHLDLNNEVHSKLNQSPQDEWHPHHCHLRGKDILSHYLLLLGLGSED